jgi:hypothetical protein
MLEAILATETSANFHIRHAKQLNGLSRAFRTFGERGNKHIRIAAFTRRTI